MKTFFKTVLMIIVIILTTTWTANAETYYEPLYGDASYVNEEYVLYKPEKVNFDITSKNVYSEVGITYLGNKNVNNYDIDTDYYYNQWFDSSNPWVAHTTFFYKNIYFKVKTGEKTVYEKDRRGVWEWRTVPIYDTISLADPRIENIKFTLKWRSYAIQINRPRTIDVRAKWVEADTIKAWVDTAYNNRGTLPVSDAVTNRKFAEDVVGDYIVKGEPEPSTQWRWHTVTVQISTDYSKNDVLCLSFGGGDAGGYIDINYISLNVEFTFNPNKTDNNAKSTAINDVRNTVTDNAYYDFTGRKIAYPQSGHTYIHNGKLIRFKKEE